MRCVRLGTRQRGVLGKGGLNNDLWEIRFCFFMVCDCVVAFDGV